MSTVIFPVIPKNTTTENKVPTTGDLQEGEIALDLVSGRLYGRLVDDTIQQLNNPGESDGLAFTPTVFTGDGSTASFQLSGTLTSDPNKVIATASGAVQRPTTDFTVLNGTLTPTTIPEAGVVWLVFAIPKAATANNAIAKALIFG